MDIEFLDFEKKFISFIKNEKASKAQLAGIYIYKMQKFGVQISPKNINQALIETKSMKYLEDVKTIAWGVLQGHARFIKYEGE